MRHKKIVICGGGNGAHTAAGVIKNRFPKYEVGLFLSVTTELQKFKENLSNKTPLRVNNKNGTLTALLDFVTDNPKDAMLDTDLILLILPAFAHEATLEEITPYLEDKASIGIIPARGGFEFSQTDRLKRFNKKNTFFGLQTLPWACRIKEYASSVDILGQKEFVSLASSPAGCAESLSGELSSLLDIPIHPLNNMLELTLGNVGQVVHPGIMYGLFSNNESAEIKEGEIPLFYHGIDEQIADLLMAMSDEIMMLSNTINRHIPTNNVLPLQEWLLKSYKNDIEDASSLLKAFRTNRAYTGLKVPVKEKREGVMIPDFNARYVSEDMPHGLVVTRGLADLMGVAMPTIDKVIIKLSGWINKEYLVNNRLEGRNIKEVRVPQNYGIGSLNDLVQLLN